MKAKVIACLTTFLLFLRRGEGMTSLLPGLSSNFPSTKGKGKYVGEVGADLSL